jgi:hypothetical protein
MTLRGVPDGCAAAAGVPPDAGGCVGALDVCPLEPHAEATMAMVTVMAATDHKRLGRPDDWLDLAFMSYPPYWLKL